MKIAIAQIESIPNQPASNLKKISDFCAQASGSDLIIFPELADFGYAPQLIKEIAPKTSCLAELKEIAKLNNINIISGHLSIDSSYQNTQIAISNQGILLSEYHKIHLINFPAFKEKSVFSPGTQTKTFQLNHTVIGQSICYDLRFPELYRKLRAENAEILTCSSAWPLQRKDQKMILVRARAVENQAFFVEASAVGDGLSGNSLVISPTGEVIAQGNESEELIKVEIDLNQLTDLRENFNTFGDCVF